MILALLDWWPRRRRIRCAIGLHRDELVIDVGTVYHRCARCCRRRFVGYVVSSECAHRWERLGWLKW